MRNTTAAVVAGICLLGGGVAGAWAQATAPDIVWRWPSSLEAVNAAPKNHKILYQDDHVSLLEVTIQPGEKENLHGHELPSVFAMDAVQPIGENIEMDGSVTKMSARWNATGPYPRATRMGPQAPHSFNNLDTIPQHFYRLQFKRIDGNSSEALSRYVRK